MNPKKCQHLYARIVGVKKNEDEVTESICFEHPGRYVPCADEVTVAQYAADVRAAVLLSHVYATISFLLVNGKLTEHEHGVEFTRAPRGSVFAAFPDDVVHGYHRGEWRP